MKKIFLLIFLFSCAVSGYSQGIAGTWNGLLDVGAAKLRLVFHIDEKEGGYTATMDSPDQSAKGIPVTSAAFDNQKLQIDAVNLNMSYEGTLANDTIKGTFTQMGQQFPLTLTKTAIEFKRPQNPKPPYPYNSENIRFENKKAGIALAGTLTWPKGGANFPVAVLVSGSGPQNRDEELMGHKPFLVVADYLTRQGIAVLRYDDRGTAESGGDYQSATLTDFASDAESAVDYLKTRKEINPKKIGIVGHSEGGTIAFMLAGEKHSPAYIVSMAGCALQGDSLMKLQRYALAHAMGATDAAIQQNETLVTRMSQLVQRHTADSVFNYPDKYAGELLPAAAKGNQAAQQALGAELRKLASPELQSFLNYNPAAALRKIKCPVLALNGEKDLQVPADANLNQLKTLEKGPLTVKKYPGLNHLFQHCTTGLINEYGSIEETISPDVLSDMATWILSVTK